jgi:hypothetical protein
MTGKDEIEMLLIRKLLTPTRFVCNSATVVELPESGKTEVHPKMGALFFMAEVPC